jgi:hypothetical protein
MCINYSTYNYNLKFQLTLCVYTWAETTQLVQRLATGRTGRGTNSGGTIFSALVQTALGPTQAPIQWVSGFIPGGKAAGSWR